MQNTDSVIVALDQLVAMLRLEQNQRLASMLHHKVHFSVWGTSTELFVEVQRILRNTLASSVSLHSQSTTLQIGKVLAAIDQSGQAGS